MNCVGVMPKNPAQQWETLLLLISSEERKIDRRGENEVEIMNYFYNNEGVRKIFTHWVNTMKLHFAKKQSSKDTSLKDDNISLYWRQKGNDVLKSGNVTDAYAYFTKSVMYADPKTSAYSIALFKRSTALMELRQFEDCLSDLNLALEKNCPDSMRPKLYLFQANCNIELGNESAAKEALKKAKPAEPASNSTAQTKEFKEHLKAMERKLGNNLFNSATEEMRLPVCHLGDNPDFVHASKAIELKRDEEVGRHVATKEAVNRGDILFVEDPYAFVALPIENGLPIVCEQCCRGDLNPVPCSTCSRAVYCGDKCRALAWAAHHKYECVGAQSRLFPTIGIAHLALRMLLVSASKGFPGLPNQTTTRQTSAAVAFKAYATVDDVSIYRKDSPEFYRVFNLITNLDKMTTSDLTQYALTASMMTFYLESCTSFFDDLPSRLPFPVSGAQARLLAAAMLLRHMAQLVCNGHAALSIATELPAFGSDLAVGQGVTVTLTENEVRHSTAIYPSAAMMNHSCDPNIVNSFYRNRLVVRSAHSLAPGVEVANCYGPHRAREPYHERRAQLRSQYMFNCACPCCSDVERRDSVLVFSAYACHKCKGPVLVRGRTPQCQQCRRTDLQMEQVTTALHAARELQHRSERAASSEKAFELLCNAYKQMQSVLYRHNTQLRKCSDKLGQYYSEQGQWNKSVEIVKQNIQSLEYQYGSFSCEVAHELRKLADVMLARLSAPDNLQHPDQREWALETNKVFKKAFQLMELNYGWWTPLVIELARQQKAVAESLPSEDGSPHYNLTI